MRLQEIEIENILSIGHVKYHFGTDDGLILLEGWNADDETANGAGKTSILNAISFGLYGKAPRKISVANFLKRGEKKGRATVSVENNGVTWTVERKRPNFVTYFKGGVEQKISQDEFESHIGLSYDQFLISMYSAQSEGKKLISLNDTEKKSFFLQLMNLQDFATSKKEADNMAKEIDGKLLKISHMMAESLTKIELYSESLVDADAIKEEMKQFDTTSLKAELDSYLIGKPDLSKFDNLEDQLRDKQSILKQEAADYRIKVARHSSDESRLNDLKLHLSACPECGHTDPETETRISDLEQSLQSPPEPVDYSQKIADIDKYLSDLRIKRELELQEYNEASDAHHNASRKINSMDFSMRALQQRLDKNDELVPKIKQCEDLYNKAEKKKIESEAELVILRTVSAIFSSTGAQAYIMDSALDTFNEKVERYVEMVWPAASYSLQSYKENKGGDIKAKFSEKLVINGEETSTGSLSGGEYRCLSLATDFAVVDTMNEMFNIDLNPIFLDEPFGGLDVVNRDRVTELLEKLASCRQVWVIDHMSESKASFDKVLKVIKKNGRSELVI
jgi:DNA repair exonuclease SbcCD ATPase subunit